jgi:hypothetical protein
MAQFARNVGFVVHSHPTEDHIPQSRKDVGRPTGAHLAVIRTNQHHAP